MTRKLTLVTLLLIASSCRAAPSTYDQRQDGDLNVKVDLDNFVILMARPVSAIDVLGSMSQLFIDSKNAKLAAALHAIESKNPESETKTIEHEFTLDPTKDMDNASIDETRVAAIVEELAKSEEAKTSIVAVQLQDAEKTARSLEEEARKSISGKSKSISGKYKIIESMIEEPQSLKLIGDSIENCGPGRSRDRSGICQADAAK